MAGKGKKKSNIENKKEIAAYNTAVNIKIPFVNRLNKCKTADAFEGILADLALAEKRDNYNLKNNSTKDHEDHIEELDNQIETLTIEVGYNICVNIRTHFINQLNDCKTAKALEGIKADLDEERERSIYELREHSTNEHIDHINELENQIETLIAEKNEEIEAALQIESDDDEIQEELPETVEGEFPDKFEGDVDELGSLSPIAPMDGRTIPQTVAAQPVNDILVVKKAEDETPAVDNAAVKKSKKAENPMVETPISPTEPTPTKTQFKAKTSNPERVEHLAAVKKQLNLLSDKRAELMGELSSHMESKPDDVKKREEYQKKINAIASIHNKVAGLYNEYISGDIELDDFKTKARPFLQVKNKDIQTLQSHRGVKQILVNLLAAIFSAVVIYGIAAFATGRIMLFNPSTNSGKKADDLRASIENAAAPAA